MTSSSASGSRLTATPRTLALILSLNALHDQGMQSPPLLFNQVAITFAPSGSSRTKQHWLCSGYPKCAVNNQVIQEVNFSLPGGTRSVNFSWSADRSRTS